MIDILWIDYDGVKWTWNMNPTKMSRLLILIARGIRQGYLLNNEARVLAGKINHYSNVREGNMNHV